MRFKYKIWDKQEKKWYKPVYEACNGKLHEILMSPSGDLSIRTMNNYLEHESNFPDRYEVVWFTGLKDKNGVEIYMGHILRNVSIETYTDEEVVNLVESKKESGLFDNHDEYFYELSKAEKQREVIRICPVKFSNSHFYCERERKQWLFLDDSESRFEVIGNVYENPELLNCV